MSSIQTYPTINDENAATAMSYLRQADPLLAPVIERAGLCPIRPHTDYYRELVEAIVGQQLSVKAAASIQRRFNALFITAIQSADNPDENPPFPTPQQILTSSVEDLRSAGLSRAKATYVQDLARHVIDGRLRFDNFTELSNQEISNELTAVKGIGQWTADMFLFFCMARSDILPVGDLGIRSGMRQIYGLDGLPDRQQMEAIATAKQWAPYTTIASWYIWQQLDNEPVKV